jgi:replication-associated recombination protein RarA
MADLRIPVGDAIELAMSLSELKRKNIDNNVCYIVGSPGIGKTSIARHKANVTNKEFIACSPALETKEKFGGIPDLIWNENKVPFTIWSIPEIIHKANELAKSNENGVVLLIDDFHV